MYKLNNRGAIFGLDARVALVIFALLSTIAGFAMYQRAEEVQDIKLYANIKQIELGLKMLKRDLGMLPGDAMVDGLNDMGEGHFSLLCYTDFLTPGLMKKWKGPYITMRTESYCQNDTYRTSDITYRVAYANSNVGVCAIGDVCSRCAVGDACFAWIGIQGVPDVFFDYLNPIVDDCGPSCTETNPETSGRLQKYSGTVWYKSEVKR